MADKVFILSQSNFSELREREEANEAGGFLRLLEAVPSSYLCLCLDHVLGVEQCLLSEDELAALCRGIASPLCTITHLSFFVDGTVSAVMKTLISDAIAHNTSIRHLTLRRSVCALWGVVPRLSSLSPCFITALFLFDCMESMTEDELAALCRAIASPLCSLLTLDVTSSSQASLSPSKTISMTEALAHNNSITSLATDFVVCSPAECLVSILSAPCSIKSLRLYLEGMDDDDRVHAIEGLALALNTVRLKSLSLHKNSFMPADYSHLWKQLALMLLTNTSLTHLEIDSYFTTIPYDIVRLFFIGLEKNRHLLSLSLLSRSVFQSWPNLSVILDSLRTNGTLHHLKLGKDDNPLSPAIEAQLRRNRENAKQFALHKVQVQPTTVRLFLCGLPYSGKTTLSKSLVRWSTNTQFVSLTEHLSRIKDGKPRRTRGIEVSTMETEGITVSLWDLAGQEEFYALHDHLFPNFSNEATPSMFLFVWCPVNVDVSTGVTIKNKVVQKSLSMFEDEFRYWLKFISSKTLKSSKFRPRVVVAVTRADLLKIDIKNWFRSVFNQCIADFKDWVELDMQGVFHMDARSSGDVGDLAFHIFNSAKEILRTMPPVYQACEDARRLLFDLVQVKNAIASVITKQQFSVVCRDHLGIDNEEMQDAVALYLNDVGDIIYFKSCEVVVLDTKWFCRHLMGNLVYFDGSRHQHHDGFFAVEFLEGLLESQVNPKSKRHLFGKSKQRPKIEGQVLVKLLIGLQLACKQNDFERTSSIFIPASLRSPLKTQTDYSYYLKGDGVGIKTFMGRRLKCKDSICTFFTPGIFPLFQVSFKSMFCGIEVTLHESVIALSCDGVNVLVEFCKHEGQDQFIDILIHSWRDLDSTIGWVYEKVIDNMERVCAEPRGIQGVEIVHEVIMPSYVKNFPRLDQRRSAAVPVEELKRALIFDLEKRGLQPDFLDNVLYTWQTTKGSDRVVDLLGHVETVKIVESYRNQFLMDIQNVIGVSVNMEACNTSNSDPRVFSSTLSGREREWIHDEVREVRKDIQKLQRDIEDMRGGIRKLCKSLLPELRQKMQELLVFMKDGEQGRLPRLFVVTQSGAGMVRRLVYAMVTSLENVRLELLCEHRGGSHLVPQQRGLSFGTLEDGMLKQALPYINIFLKLAGVAVKVGAHFTAGLGDAVPDFSRVVALIDTPRLPSYSEANTSSMNFQEGQQWLYNVLSKHDCLTSTRIHEQFELSRVRYNSGHVGWLCKEHLYEGELAPI